MILMYIKVFTCRVYFEMYSQIYIQSLLANLMYVQELYLILQCNHKNAYFQDLLRHYVYIQSLLTTNYWYIAELFINNLHL